MLVIPHKKLKSREATMNYLLDPARLKSFVLELRAYLKSTQHLFQKDSFENDPRQCKHRSLFDRPETVMFRRFNHFCCDHGGLEWEAAREMMEIMLSDRFMCECEMVWRMTDEEVEEILSRRRKR